MRRSGSRILAPAQNYSTACLLASDIPRQSSQSARMSPIVVSIPKAMSRLLRSYLGPRPSVGITTLLGRWNGEVLVYIGQQRSALFDLHILAMLDQAYGPKQHRQGHCASHLAFTFLAFSCAQAQP